jgi:putative FmdB family regulatory protein
MPDYDFYCRRCEKSFSSHMTIQDHDEHPAECPTCHRADQVDRLISHFNVVTTKKSAHV